MVLWHWIPWFPILYVGFFLKISKWTVQKIHNFSQIKEFVLIFFLCLISLNHMDMYISIYRHQANHQQQHRSSRPEEWNPYVNGDGDGLSETKGGTNLQQLIAGHYPWCWWWERTSPHLTCHHYFSRIWLTFWPLFSRDLFSPFEWRDRNRITRGGVGGRPSRTARRCCPAGQTPNRLCSAQQNAGVRITFSELIGVGFPVRVASVRRETVLVDWTLANLFLLCLPCWPTFFSSVYRALDVAAPSFSNEGIDVAVGDVWPCF
jgi:hypothetical protein